MQKETCRISKELQIAIEINHNPYSLLLDNVLAMAARNNSKRSYLFVSKLIGKHIPVKPQIPLITGSLLAAHIADYIGLTVKQEQVDDIVEALSTGNPNDCLPILRFKSVDKVLFKVLFIGFAETATALGHAVYACFAENSSYLHTTREKFPSGDDTIYFTEDHCHAPAQKCIVLEPSLFKDKDYIILIDDEITTGNFGLNTIRAIQKKFPQKRYVIVAILDWRSTASKQKYKVAAEELNIKIDVISLLSGSFTISDTALHNQPPPENNNHPQQAKSSPPAELPPVKMIHAPLGDEIKHPDGTNLPYLRHTGRFGVNGDDSNSLEILIKELGEKLRVTRRGEKTLCLGTGEFMYIPFCIACHMGEGVVVQSTTRSPVYPNQWPEYAIKDAIEFYDPSMEETANFVYNIKSGGYDEVYIFWERYTSPEQVLPLVKGLNSFGIVNITFVSHTR